MNNKIKIPNLPKNPISAVLVDGRINEAAVSFLENKNIRVFKTIPHPELYAAVSGHPDMVFHHLENDIFVAEPSMYDYFSKLLPNLTILCGKTRLQSKYPLDIAYNAARVGRSVFHNFKYTDPIILEYYRSLGAKLINVKQGYSKCSICVVADNAIITSDKGIAYAAEQNGIAALLISENGILLSGLSHGFIGGCSGKLSENTIFFNGNLMKHPNAAEIIEFCRSFGVEAVYAGNEAAPEDIGTVIPLY